MFQDINKNLIYLKGAYKKLKSYYHYNKSMFFIRKKIAVFENSENFDGTFIKLAESLKNPLRHKEYFNSLYNNINSRILPKKFEDNNPNGIAATSNYFKEEKFLKRVNYYIDAPIELLILDSLWTILLFKIAKDENLLNENMYGNYPSKNLFYINQGIELENQINFNSIYLFEKYYDKYCDWHDNAFKILEMRKNDGQDSILYSLDIKNFFYHVNFSYHNFLDLFMHNAFLSEIEILSQIIFSSARVYTKIINELRSDLKITTENNIIFPIGYLSSLVLSNIYLLKFDKEIVDKLKPCFYGRYVDDIQIVLPVEKDTFEKSRSEVGKFKKKLLNIFLEKKVFKEDSNNLFIASYNNLLIQKEKISCIHIAAKGSTNLFNIYDDLFKHKPSIMNQIADFDLHFSRFSRFAYEIQTQANSLKIKDLVSIFPQEAKTKKFIDNSIICSLGSYNSNKENDFLESNFDEIITFYADSKGLENPSAWLSLFYLFVINHRPDYANKYYLQISKEISNIKSKRIEDINPSKEKNIINKTKNDFLNELNVAYETAFALNIKDCNANNANSAMLFRRANMFRQDLIIYPMMSFSSKSDDYNFSLIDFYNYNEKETFSEILNSKKLEFTPRFITFSELNLYYFFNSLFIKKKENPARKFIGIKDKYYKINGIRNNELLFTETSIKNKDIVLTHYLFDTKSEQMKKLKINQDWINKQKKKESKIRIGVASVNLSEKEVINKIDDPHSALSIKFKKRVFNLIFAAIKETVNVLVFPEFYLPFEWIGTISKICCDHRLTIVSGLQYLRTVTGVKNYSIIIQPLLSKLGNKSTFELLREKNNYAPEEKKALAAKGFTIEDVPTPIYDLIDYGDLKYSMMICYELTDIKARAVLKSLVNTVYAIEFNSDTNYYSNLVESLSRDIQAFVVQVNTAQYGDSRITAPYKSEKKDIVKIKGGLNDTFICGEIDVVSLNNTTKSYHRNFQKSIHDALNPNRKNKKKILNQARKLTSEEIKDIIKELNKNLPKEKPLSAGKRADSI